MVNLCEHDTSIQCDGNGSPFPFGVDSNDTSYNYGLRKSFNLDELSAGEHILFRGKNVYFTITNRAAPTLDNSNCIYCWPDQLNSQPAVSLYSSNIISLSKHCNSGIHSWSTRLASPLPVIEIDTTVEDIKLLNKDGFIDKLAQLDTDETKHEAIQFLYRKVNEYLRLENYADCNHFIWLIDKSNFSLRLRIALLTATARRKEKLEFRKLFIQHTKEIALRHFNEEEVNMAFLGIS